MSGTMVDSQPFGETLPNEDPDNNGINFTYNLRFPGQFYDQETGLHYNYFRDYDPSIGRYLESDPIGLIGGLNTYLYANANSYSFIDLLGLEFKITIGIGGSIGGNPILGWPGFFGGGGLSIGITSCGQIIIQANAKGSVGTGIYAGVGVEGQISKTECPTKSGISVSQSVQGEFAAGGGPSVGGSVQYDKSGSSGIQAGGGKLGVGFGIQASGGISQTVTIATPALFPSDNPKCGCDGQ